MASEARVAGRVERILAARRKVAARLDAHPKAPQANAWKRKMAEFDVSIENLQRFGQETAPTGNPVSVKIDVPKGTFAVKSHAPEG